MKHLAYIAVAALVLAVGIACGSPASPLAQSPSAGGCPIFPIDNVWNAPVDGLPAHPSSAAYISSIGAGTSFHPDFGSDPTYGIPIDIVSASQAAVGVTFDYADESDPGPYPIRDNPPIESGSDHHILIVQQGSCKLYELYDARLDKGAWYAGSGAIFDLRANGLRTDGYTSADAAGLPIMPGLVRRDEVLAGQINHALRFTARRTRKAHVWPARHDASDLTDPGIPPMGQRFRLKASFDISGYPAYDQVILTAMKKYGLILADNGSDWYVSGQNDIGWDDNALEQLKRLRGSDFEAVDVSSLIVSPDSAQVPFDRKTVAPSVARQGQQASYTIQIAGAGATMSMSDPLPGELSIVGAPVTEPASVAPAAYDPATRTITWSDAPPVSVGVKISYTVTVDTAAIKPLVNVATVSRAGAGAKQLRAMLLANPLQRFMPLSRR